MTTRAEADEQLANAIRNHAITAGIANPDAELLDSYAIIACWAPVEGDGTHTYTTHFDHPEVPTHVAVGLFAYGAQLAQEQPEEP